MSPIMDLKAQAHHLKPIILIGKNGITQAVLNEIDAALKAHELIKIKFQESALEIMKSDTKDWINQLKANLVSTQGHIITLYRQNPKKPKKNQ